jgi:uncharacterized protein YwqG
MDKTPIASAFAAAGLAQMAHAVDRLVLPSIRITATRTDEDAISVGASKLGGAPDLPAIFEWPELNGAPMSFIAQIRLEDLKGIDGAQALPPAGMLWFFYDAAQETYGSDPADRAGRQLFFVDYLSEGQLRRVSASKILTAGAPRGRFNACAVSFSSEATLPERPNVEMPSLMWSPDDQKRYEAFYAAFPSKQVRGSAQHRLLGHPDTIQDDMRGQCQLMTNGVSGSDDPRATTLLANSNDWQLLLQVDSDDGAGMHWANTGMLYFWIKRADLASRNFDNVWVVLQSE